MSGRVLFALAPAEAEREPARERDGLAAEWVGGDVTGRPECDRLAGPGGEIGQRVVGDQTDALVDHEVVQVLEGWHGGDANTLTRP